VAPWGWRLVFVWGSLALFFPFFSRRLEESPRWYENQGRTAEAGAALNRTEQQVAKETGPLGPVPARESPATEAPHAGLAALLAPGTLNRTLLLLAVWIWQSFGFYGFNAWVPTLLTERGFSIVRSLEQSSVMQIGAVPGAWIAASISDRWQRKSLIAIVALAVATCGITYGLSFSSSMIVVFGFLVAMGQQVFAPLLYAYTPECFPTNVRNTGAGMSYGIGRLGNAFGPLLVAFLFNNYGYTSVFVYIAVCWALVAVLITALGPRTKGGGLAVRRRVAPSPVEDHTKVTATTLIYPPFFFFECRNPAVTRHLWPALDGQPISGVMSKDAHASSFCQLNET